MSRFEALEALTRVGLDVDESTQSVLRRGQLMRQLLRQGRLSHRSTGDQVLLLVATSEGWLDACEAKTVSTLVDRLIRPARTEAAAVMAAIDGGGLPKDWKEQLAVAVHHALSGAGA